MTYNNPQNLDFRGEPGDIHRWGSRTKAPRAEPKALTFAKIEPGVGAPLKHSVYTKDCADGGKRVGHQQGVVCTQQNDEERTVKV